MEAFFSAIANFGFPIVVAAYLLFRFEKKVDTLTEAITGREGLISRIGDLEKVVCKDK